jgi:hypothetical protein
VLRTTGFSQRVGEADAHCRAEWLGWDIDCRLRAGEGQQEAGDHNNEANETALAAKAAVAPATARSSPPSAGPMAWAGLPFAPLSSSPDQPQRACPRIKGQQQPKMGSKQSDAHAKPERVRSLHAPPDRLEARCLVQSALS